MAIDDEYEYEYSTTETETFFIDLDLSSVNGVIKSSSAGKHRSLKTPTVRIEDTTTAQSPARAQAQAQADNEGNDEEEDEDAASPEQQQQAGTGEAQSPKETDVLDDFGDNIQILELHSPNPIISYRNNIYSCTWTDMIGTNMFFTKHQETPLYEPEISTEDYDLVGTSRIKLVGRKAKVEARTKSKKRKHTAEEGEEDGNNDNEDERAPSPSTDIEQYVPAGRSLGSIKRTNPRANAAIKQQANFLEKLMEVKKARGETDTVRTFVDRHTVAAESKRKAGTTSSNTQNEINDLNRRVVQGDNDALERLQEIYSRMEEAGPEQDETSAAAEKSPHVQLPAVDPTNTQSSFAIPD